MDLATAIGLAALLVTVALAAFKAIAAYGRNAQALATAQAEVGELRKSVASIGERVGRLEARHEAERDLSSGHRRPL